MRADGAPRRACSTIAASVLVACALVVALVFGRALPVGAEDLAREDPDGAQELADRHAPIVVIKAQEAPCDGDGEPFAPASVDVVLDNPEVLLRQVGVGDPVIIRGPGAADLFGLGEGFFIDFPGGALEPGCIYERDFDRYREGHPPVVYAHIVQQQDRPEFLALQYWFYWYYNDWNNKHESDWEGIQVLFEASSIEEALASEPVSVGYAQHEGGERADWDSSKLERDGVRPVVYSSAGSHASYFGSALYIGRSGGEGFGCDNTDGPSERLDPEVVVLPDSVDDASDSLAWLGYEGRWGERQRGPFNGPTGPLAKGRWLEPVSWHDELRSSSVVIPGGDSAATDLISVFCGVVEWGSGTLIEVTVSPVRLTITALLAGLLIRWLVRRTDWSPVALLPVRRRRRAGQIIRTAMRGFWRTPRALIAFGLIYIPTVFLTGLVATVLSWVPVLGDILDLAGTASGTGLSAALLASVIAGLAAYVGVEAMVAVFIDRAESGDPVAARQAALVVWERRRALISGFARAVVIVVGLLFTIVGIPWAIRQLVRYQFLPQVAMLEERNGREALVRSSELVRGRWWHTAGITALLNAVIGLAALLVGLVMLLVFRDLPLWLFSMFVTLALPVVVPLASTVQVLLYGDAVAEQEKAAPAELLGAG